ncbi:MAG: hypothetical protein U0W24_07245 [Bacteroidales bacterium]
MEKPEKRIVDFIKKHHVLTLATSQNNTPWCANCFYALMEEENSLVFTSDIQTRHIREALEQVQVAGSIVLETNIVGKIQGIQFSGILTQPQGPLYTKAEKAYLKRFPFAALMDTTLWILKMNYIKMTDNRLGFGKKIIWERKMPSDN